MPNFLKDSRQIYLVSHHYFHSSEKKSLCLIKLPGETLQNLPYKLRIWNTKTKVIFYYFPIIFFYFDPYYRPGQ